jgi:hypothetical protein
MIAQLGTRDLARRGGSEAGSPSFIGVQLHGSPNPCAKSFSLLPMLVRLLMLSSRKSLLGSLEHEAVAYAPEHDQGDDVARIPGPVLPSSAALVKWSVTIAVLKTSVAPRPHRSEVTS